MILPFSQPRTSWLRDREHTQSYRTMLDTLPFFEMSLWWCLLTAQKWGVLLFVMLTWDVEDSASRRPQQPAGATWCVRKATKHLYMNKDGLHMPRAGNYNVKYIWSENKLLHREIWCSMGIWECEIDDVGTGRWNGELCCPVLCSVHCTGLLCFAVLCCASLYCILCFMSFGCHLFLQVLMVSHPRGSGICSCSGPPPFISIECFPLSVYTPLLALCTFVILISLSCPVRPFPALSSSSSGQDIRWHSHKIPKRKRQLSSFICFLIEWHATVTQLHILSQNSPSSSKCAGYIHLPTCSLLIKLSKSVRRSVHL